MAEAEQEKELNPRVLFVDDDENPRFYAGRLFQEQGVEFRIFSSAREAIEAIRNERFTHVFTDGLGGGWEEVVKAAQEAGCKKIAVVSVDPKKIAESAPEGIEVWDKNEFLTQPPKILEED